MKARSLLTVSLLVLSPMGMLYALWADPLSAGEDDLVYYYPLRVLAAEQLRDGVLPIHNPRQAGGVPLLADPQSALLHPTTWLFLAMGARLAYALSAFAAFSLAGGGAYLYLRRLGLIRPASAFGALAFMFCGFMVGHRVHLSVVLAAAMLPWGLWCIEHLRRRGWAQEVPGRRSTYLGVLLRLVPVVFLAVAAGHWPTVIHLGLIWGAYLLLRARPLPPAIAVCCLAALLAGALAAPQIDATASLLAAATRNRIGYATAGENSFFPPAAVLAVFPHLMGSRTPNFFPQQWWGPWHLCEMLGYVGLATLVLALAAVRRLYRRPAPAALAEGASPAGSDALARQRQELSGLVSLVRSWTWLLIGAGVFMLGYYLPTYRLVHMLPLIGVIRCPARMVLAVDMGLAALAAIAVHAIVTLPRNDERIARLARTVRLGSAVALPAAMVLALAVFAGLGAAARAWGLTLPVFSGTADDMLAAVSPANPAVWVQFVLAGLTALVLWRGLARRDRPGWALPALPALLAADLLLITAFVDVPAGRGPRRPEESPAARWLADNGPPRGTYRVLGLADSYHDRPEELLLPKACEALGVWTIGNYGPFQSAGHAQLFGFRVWGQSRHWAALVRRNHLLSLYGVRYLLAAGQRQRQVIESVRIADGPAEQGPNLLTGRWRLWNAAEDAGELVLRSARAWLNPSAESSGASQAVKVQPGGVYRIALDAAAGPRGAASWLRAELSLRTAASPGWDDADSFGLNVEPEQMGGEWRHFEWTFRVPPDAAQDATFVLSTASERPLRVRNVSLRASDFESPVNLGGRLAAGQSVYRKLVELKPLRAGDEPVAVYENLLFMPVPVRRWDERQTAARIESLKWRTEGFELSPPPSVPDVSLRAAQRLERAFYGLSLPAAACWAGLALWALWRRGGRARPEAQNRPV